MIFYTLLGPTHKLEVHDDKIKLIKRSYWKFLGPVPEESWELHELSKFEISTPKFLFSGKIEWSTFDGRRETFRFTTNAKMMGMIEKYLQKVVMKNYKVRFGTAGVKGLERRPAPLEQIAA